MSHDTLIELVNDLLAWRDGAHGVLNDWLEDHGFGSTFRNCGGIHRHDGIVLALLQIQAIQPLDVFELQISPNDLALALEQYVRKRQLPWDDEQWHYMNEAFSRAELFIEQADT